MEFALAVLLFAAGVGLVLLSAEKVVDATIASARALGVSTFVISVLFIGFDPENLAVGAVGAYEGVAGIALGSIIGAAMVAIALALGITSLIVPLRFPHAPRRTLLLPLPAVVLFGALVLDGRLGRLDGAILLLGYAVAVLYVLRLDRGGAEIRREIEGDEGGRGEIGAADRDAGGPAVHVEGDEGGGIESGVHRDAGGPAVRVEGDEGAGGGPQRGRWRALGFLLLALAGIILGSELIVYASESLLARIGITETAFGMTIVALAVSIEEVARELPAALRGHAEISVGNVVGSAFAFFLLNAGIIALVHPVPVGDRVLAFHLPVAAAVVAFISLTALSRRVPRWAGALLVLAYAFFVVGSY